MTAKPVSDSGVTVGYPAGLGRRLGALFYDGLLIIALWMGTLFIWVLASDGEVVSGWPVQVVLGIELVSFYTYFWSRQGQTLGMAAWHIKLVDRTGHLPGMRQILTRICCAPLSIICAGLGYLWIYVNKDKQTWHDQLSDTLIVYTPSTSSSHRR